MNVYYIALHVLLTNFFFEDTAQLKSANVIVKGN